jgi:hypothetical protein
MRYVLWIAAGRPDGPTLKVVEADSVLAAAQTFDPNLKEEDLKFTPADGAFGPGWSFRDNSVVEAQTKSEVQRLAMDLMSWIKEDIDSDESSEEVLADSGLWPNELGEWPLTQGT